MAIVAIPHAVPAIAMPHIVRIHPKSIRQRYTSRDGIPDLRSSHGAGKIAPPPRANPALAFTHGFNGLNQRCFAFYPKQQNLLV
jgi:hypothetical protein